MYMIKVYILSCKKININYINCIFIVPQTQCLGICLYADGASKSATAFLYYMFTVQDVFSIASCQISFTSSKVRKFIQYIFKIDRN